jgi:hypothetical protein
VLLQTWSVQGMNSYIKQIVIFGEEDQKRVLKLTNGLNIIKGHSKKGKSALIEIVDYCLCSTIPSIPKGIISDFASLFCVILKAETNYIVIARPSTIESQSKIYVSIEPNSKFLSDFNSSYFDDIPLMKIKGAGQENIEKALGLNVLNPATSELSESDRKKGKASIRNMTPFLYQYQNLIASKHALFSKLDDYNKKQSILEQIPIFLGLVDSEYYSIRRQIDELQKKLKDIEKEKVREQQFNKQYERKLEGHLRNYFSLIGQEIPKYNSVINLITISKELPGFHSSDAFKTDSTRRYNSLRESLAEKSLKLNNINTELLRVKDVSKNAKLSQSNLTHIKNKNELLEDIDCSCPLCGTEVESLTEESQQINLAMHSLNLEVNSMSNFARYDAEQVESLNLEKRTLQKQISELNIQINELESYTVKLKEYRDKRDSLGYLKAKIEVVVEQVSNKTQLSDYGEKDLIKELNELKSSLTHYDFKKDFMDCQVKLNLWMNELANKLDFEEQFKPADFFLNLENLTIHHNDKKYGRVKLSDFGSGANWLAFHLSASIGLLRLFSYKKKSPVPNFLFLDQPSQVYFPSDFKDSDDNDIQNVANIYIAILDSLRDGRKESGRYSQVIVLDHADNLNLEHYKYSRYVRASWFGEEALI